MKSVFVILSFVLFSCSTKGQKTDVPIVPLTKKELVNKVLKTLNIDESKTDFIVAKISPNNPKETIVVVPEVVNEDEEREMYELNSNIVIVNNFTGKITHKFFETSKTSGWVSDAILISQIAIDTTSYQLNKKNQKAFGVKISFRSMSQPNPYSSEYISLFTKHKTELVKIVDNHMLYESLGVVNVNTDACYADFKDVYILLSMRNTVTNDYYDISSVKTVTQRLFKLDENGECNPVEKLIAKDTFQLKYNEAVYKKVKPITIAAIDTESIEEIKHYEEEKRASIYEYYKVEEIDEVDIWSDRMFGRCCSEADLNYSHLLYFDITANSDNKKYPPKNLSDNRYRTAFVFKEDTKTEISLQLSREDDWHKSQTDLLVDDVMKVNDTLLSPFKLSIVNGYVKSAKTFKENARVKIMDVFLNDEYKGSVKLLDTPLVQQFNLDFTFFKNDVVKLIPASYYKGSKYDDVCISEVQSSLSQITHKSINKKYKSKSSSEKRK